MASQQVDEHVQGTTGKTLKRRGILAAAGAMVAGIAAKASGASGTVSANTGDFLTLGSIATTGTPTNTAANPTAVVYTGAALANNNIFQVSDSPSTSAFPAVVGGLTFNGTVPYGVYGYTANTNYAGVVGASPNSVGVYGTSTNNAGVYGFSTNTNGVYGTTNVTTGGFVGVFGNVSGSDVYGAVGSNHDAGTGVYGFSASGTGIIGKTSTGLYGIVGFSGSSQGSAGLLGVATGPNAVGFGTIAQNGATFAGYFNGTTVVNGAFAVTGSKSAAVKDAVGDYRLMYSMESPEAWFEDFGTSTLANGKAEVKIDPLFAQHIHTDDFHVFITEHDQHNDLLVTARTAQGFSVQADDATLKAKGKSAASVNTTFSYRVVAKRNDITGERLAKFTMPPTLVAPEAPTTIPTPNPIKPGVFDRQSAPAARPSTPSTTGASSPAPAPLPPSAPAVSGSPSSGGSTPVAAPKGRP